MTTLHDFAMQDIDGNHQKLSDFEGRVVLVVNVASKCGLTPQYDGLQRLYDQYRKQGLEVLAFPCNQFMKQEPGTEAEIKEFCTIQYGATFRLFSKIEVNGEGRAPLYEWLSASDVGPEESGDIQWNFGKFLIGTSGEILARFGPQTEPGAKEVVSAVESALP